MPTASVASRGFQVSTVATFTPQEQETHLNAKAMLEIPRLKRNNHLEALQKHLAQATEYLTKSVGDINDTAFEERSRHNNKLTKLKNNNQEEPKEEKDAYETFQQCVETLTKKMDASIRQVIDDRSWVKTVPESIDHVHSMSTEASSRATQQQQQSQEDEDDEDSSSLMNRPDPAENATALLQAAQTTAEAQWKGKTLEERYAKDNDYIGFFTTTWQAKNQGEHAPPVPHASVWFAEADGRGSQRQRSTQENPSGDVDAGMDDSEDDVQIAYEQTRLTCPLTLLPFTNPVTSTKCRHSFEKDAILDMIRKSHDYLPWTSEQEVELSRIRREPERRRREAQIGAKAVRCPETGCEVRISEADLRSDPALMRRVKRWREAKQKHEEAERRQAEREAADEHDIDDDDDDEDDIPRASQHQRRNVVALGSSPAVSTQQRRRATLVKGERVSMVPQTQLSSDDDREMGNT